VTRGILVALAATSLAAGNPIPETFTNLEVLPKDVPRDRLVEAMKGFTAALGVRCPHCHASREGAPPDSERLEDLDFASDAKDAKRTARLMMRMVGTINRDHLAKLSRPDRLEVGCATCHRGVARPEAIGAIVARALRDDGAAAAAATYRDLRERYLETGSYDFSEGPLADLGTALLAGGDAEGAVAVLALDEEFHPASGRVAVLLGEAHLARGDRAAARAAFARAVEIAPGNPRARKRLEELERAAGEPDPGR